jgi:hypothetical protein
MRCSWINHMTAIIFSPLLVSCSFCYQRCIKLPVISCTWIVQMRPLTVQMLTASFLILQFSFSRAYQCNPSEYSSETSENTIFHTDGASAFPTATNLRTSELWFEDCVPEFAFTWAVEPSPLVEDSSLLRPSSLARRRFPGYFVWIMTDTDKSDHRKLPILRD